ncbi:hypothetical protein CRI94_02275 [Longibacter salinarum]|uniref:Lactate/malate dehydrogenase C-terminal domain-containing protein n=1 Tax=Longibacter salinarum TaxID=1850348 RepID=A0A2A8D2N7_9BACT|nr:hypothetical protein [Longibacter salinarum]PEN15134.1 hypothetical protein CRI94_02275 [Longibacter salinarum]
MEDRTASLTQRIGIVGSGPTAASVAHALLRIGIAKDLVSVPPPGGSETHSLTSLMRTHTPVGASSLHSGIVEDLSDARVVVIAMEPVEDPSQEIESLRELVAKLDNVAPDAVIIVAGKPVDESTCAIIQATERPRERVFGIGTCMETMELRRRVSKHYEVDESSVYAMVIGHHGGAAVPVWSHVLIGAHPIVRGHVVGKPFDRKAMWDAFDRGCDRAAHPVDDKRTRRGFEQCVADCVRSVVRDERRVLPVSARVDGPFDVRGVCLALPTIVGRNGCHGRVLPDLAPDEVEAFRAAAATVREKRSVFA